MKGFWSISIMTLLLSMGLGARAADVLTIATVEGQPDEEVTVGIDLQNTSQVSALQVAIPLGPNIHYVAGSVSGSRRLTDHTLSAYERDGVLSIIVYSVGMQAVDGDSGELLSFRLKLGNVPETQQLSPTRLILTSPSGEQVEATATPGSVTTRCAKATYSKMNVNYGEVPIRGSYQQELLVVNEGNAPLIVTGLVFSSERFSCDVSLPQTIEAGENLPLTLLYEPLLRGAVDEDLRVVCNSVSRLNTIRLQAQPFAVNELHIQPAQGRSDEMVTVSVTMNNMDNISGLQMEMNLPEQFEYVDGSFHLSERGAGLSGYARCEGQTLRALAMSTTGATFAGNDGEVATFQLKLSGRNGSRIEFSKAVLTAQVDGSLLSVLSACEGAYINIESPTLSSADQVDFGRVPTTEEAVQTLDIYNSGSAPLTINRVVLDYEGLSVRESLPMTIESWETRQLTLTCNAPRGYFETVMQVYSNDPDLRLKNIVVCGTRFAPNQLTLSAGEFNAGEVFEVAVKCDNVYDLHGMQFDLHYPANVLTLLDDNGIELSPRLNGGQLMQRTDGSGLVHVIVFSMADVLIPAGEGPVAILRFQPKDNMPYGNYTISIDNIKLGASETDDAASNVGEESLTFSYIKAPPQIDDVYQIGTADDLCTFAALVNNGLVQANACLINDIDMTGYNANFIPIGSTSALYQGTFDGQNHRISNLHVQGDDYIGLFGCVTGGAIIRQLTLDATCSIKGNAFVAVVGGSNGYGTVTIERVGNEGAVRGDAQNVAGIIGCNMESSASFVIRDCYNTGTIIGGWESSAISGWVGSDAVLVNCYNTGTVSGLDSEDTYLYRGTVSKEKNLYSTIGSQGTIVEEEKVTNGELCYLLNEGNVKTPVWLQTLSVDSHPVFFTDHKVVLQVNSGYINLQMGDVNGDGVVNVFDINEMVRKIQGTPSDIFIERAADLGHDGIINVFDINEVIRIIQNK